jgi:Tol biopolymer transport system component
MNKILMTLLFWMTQFCVFAQPRITNVEQLPLERSQGWSNPQFSPDGKSIFFTTESYNGVWQYSLQHKTQRLITNDPRSGYGFSVAPDGKAIAYRRTTNEGARNRMQEIVLKELSSNSIQIIGRQSTLSTPSFSGAIVLYSEDNSTKNLHRITATARPIVLGIENTKIAVIVATQKRLLDPLANGSYIWPVLSPDGSKLVASDMAKGAFVCDLKGSILARLGKRNAAAWTRDGRWLIYMKDKDDGHTIISSDLFCVSADGKLSKQLTMTKGVIEMYPQCSLVENKIVCNTLDGKILLMSYEGGKR